MSRASAASACGPSAARSRRARASGGGAPRALRNADKTMTKRSLLVVVLLTITAAALGAATRQAASPEARVDAVLAKWTTTSPGCAVGVSQNGRSVLQKAYGMADLEHDAPIKPDTIFEAGSVSKQFTAAAILLLARDGKLSLDDEVRKYIPELPDYGAPLTIRHMLNHTSGLRDWGNVAAIAGWPRGTRAHTHANVLDIVSRQRELNFPSGTRVLLLQYRLQPRRNYRRAGERSTFRRVHARAHLRSARDDPHLLARRLHAHRQGPRDCVLGRRWRVHHRDAIRERPREWRPPDDRW